MGVIVIVVATCVVIMSMIVVLDTIRGVSQVGWSCMIGILGMGGFALCLCLSACAFPLRITFDS